MRGLLLGLTLLLCLGVSPALADALPDCTPAQTPVDYLAYDPMAVQGKPFTVKLHARKDQSDLDQSGLLSVDGGNTFSSIILDSYSVQLKATSKKTSFVLLVQGDDPLNGEAPFCVVSLSGTVQGIPGGLPTVNAAIDDADAFGITIGCDASTAVALPRASVIVTADSGIPLNVRLASMCPLRFAPHTKHKTSITRYSNEIQISPQAGFYDTPDGRWHSHHYQVILRIGDISTHYSFIERDYGTPSRRIWESNFDDYVNICVNHNLKTYASGGQLYCDIPLSYKQSVTIR